MADFEKAIPIILKHEGGYVNHPSDPGGATNRGITYSVFGRLARPLLGINPTLLNLRGLTEDQAKKIYKHEFWDKMKGNLITDQQIAEILFDGFVNKGKNGIKLMQSVLQQTQDGIVGPLTLNAINTADPFPLFESYKQSRVSYYKNLALRKPKLNVFLKGWLIRINSFHYHS